MDSVSPVWSEAYAANPRGIQAGWRSILGPISFPREVLVQLPKARNPKTGEMMQGRYDLEVKTFQQYAAVLLENAPRRDLWVGWGRTQDYDAKEMTWIYGDVDSTAGSTPTEALQEALRRARKYEEFAMDTFNVQPATLFSCGKGFHCHLTHDPVPYRGAPYSDAILRLSDPYRVYLDAGPLKHRSAKPRVPYSINLKASGREKAPMFVVPVDLTWDLKEIIQAAKECRVTPFKVPHSREAAKVIEPLAKASYERRKRAQERRIAMGQTGADPQRIRDAVAFCEANGPLMVDGRGRPDGRKRLLYQVYVPALAHLLKGDQDAVVERCRTWVEAVGGSWDTYQPIVRGTLKSCFREEGDILQPMNIPRWLAENAGLRFPSRS